MVDLQNNMDVTMIKVQKFVDEFNEQQERYEVCLKKMNKDKRATV